MATFSQYKTGDYDSLSKTMGRVKPKIVDKHFGFDDASEDIEYVYLRKDAVESQGADKNANQFRELIFENKPKLRFLNANRCSIRKIVIRDCPNLQSLFLVGNGLEEIVFEGKFPKLELIDLSKNALTKIDLPFENFGALKHLYLNENKLVDLSNLTEFFVREDKSKLAEFFGQKDFDFNIEKNESLTAPPAEIVKQGKDAIRNYMNLLFKEQKQKLGNKYSFEAKLLIIGEGGTGKTTLLRKLQSENAVMPKKEDTTYGIAIDKWVFDIFPQLFPNLNQRTQNEIMVNCWDFGGQKIYHGTHQIFFGENSFYILVADTREGLTDFKYWFNTIEQLAGDNAQLLVIVNQKFGHVFKFDREGYKARFTFVDEDISIDLNTEYNENDKNKGIENKVKNQNNVLNIKGLQTKVKTRIQEMPIMGQPLSATYIAVREDLFKLSENYIDFSKLRGICLKHGVTDLDTMRYMSKYFNDIGAITHFFDDDLLRERVFLNSDWLVKTIYKVLDDCNIKEKQGRICLEDFSHIWKKDKLDFEIKHLTLIMDKFGLMYQVSDSKNFVVPAHLPNQKPYGVWLHSTDSNVLRFKYEFGNYMPEGLMSHFIVALHTYIENHDFVWQLGMNIAFENTYAEIIETYGEKNTFQIIIAGERKKELLTIIRLKFKEILKPFKKLNYEELVPCNCTKCCTLQDPNYYDYKLLQEYIDEKAPEIQCKYLKRNVSIQQILDNIIIDKEINRIADTMKSNKIFISYSSADRKLRGIFEDNLSIYLKSAKYKYDSLWSDVEIPVGGEWNEVIQSELNQSNIGILLVSPKFLGSEYGLFEFRQMLERRKSEGYTIVPVLLRNCNFQNSEELKKIQFVKTYQSEYGLTDKDVKDLLMPFDKLLIIEDPYETYINEYFLKVTNAIDKAVGG